MERRSFIRGSAIAALATTAIPAAAFAPASDAALEAAWSRWKDARRAYSALTDGHPNEAVQWSIVDGAEETIRVTDATTPRGTAIKLWIALAHTLTTRPEDEAIMREDLPYLLAEDANHDWNVRLILSTLHSLSRLT